MADRDNLPPCPICAGGAGRPYHRDSRRDYVHCQECALVFVPPEQHLSPAAERAVYRQHQNDPDDAGYRRFLARLFAPLHERLPADASGLDFGSGPGPTLSLIFEEAGHEMALYDPFYAPDRSVLEKRYDFITLSEVAEHLSRPGKELDDLWSLIKPNGWLGIMTKRVIDADAFAGWHYKEDPTHVCFFADKTFDFLASRWGAQATFIGKDVVLMQKI